MGAKIAVVRNIDHDALDDIARILDKVIGNPRQTLLAIARIVENTGRDCEPVIAYKK
jgi:hypothetical protein